MAYLVDELEALGMAWAYRVIDARAFGLPQRRKRVILLASRSEDPRTVLFADDCPLEEPSWNGGSRPACGFYWTEGLRGLGWCVDGVPTLKGGSTVGIPSPPAIWKRDGSLATLDVRDAERLQGLPLDWTAPATAKGARWRLVGNAVSAPVAEFIGRRISAPGEYDRTLVSSNGGWRRSSWPDAAWGVKGERRVMAASHYPVQAHYTHLDSFLKYTSKPLSPRAAAGFLSRSRRSSLHFPSGLLEAVSRSASKQETDQDAVA
jgi:DNA (cytosine-5)-methyltransferase 1